MKVQVRERELNHELRGCSGENRWHYIACDNTCTKLPYVKLPSRHPRLDFSDPVPDTAPKPQNSHKNSRLRLSTFCGVCARCPQAIFGVSAVSPRLRQQSHSLNIPCLLPSSPLTRAASFWHSLPSPFLVNAVASPTQIRIATSLSLSSTLPRRRHQQCRLAGEGLYMWVSVLLSNLPTPSIPFLPVVSINCALTPLPSYRSVCLKSDSLSQKRYVWFPSPFRCLD